MYTSNVGIVLKSSIHLLSNEIIRYPSNKEGFVVVMIFFIIQVWEKDIYNTKYIDTYTGILWVIINLKH